LKEVSLRRRGYAETLMPVGTRTTASRRGVIGSRGEKTIFIPGFHAVKAALCREETKIQALWVARGKRKERVQELLDTAERKGIPVAFKARPDWDRRLPSVSHQGILALMGGFAYSDLRELLQGLGPLSGKGLLVAADHITDEGNLGALIRTAAFFGSQGLILPKDRSARVTERVIKRSSGAMALLPVIQVVNLGRTLDELREKGFWVIGAAGEARESIHEFDWKRDLVLVLGSEDKGLSRSVRDRCDHVVRIAGPGSVPALNVSVAGGIILAEILRQRENP
jgi:23S rRNA (guanosine2251-2'-O)-methyltransferase